ncbi:MAG: hypothetical protein IT371_15590 [Deltaproteobacteria bacterium]|nr:hypothetical protein [Deltaproteobacteria bacterium]
MVLVVCAVLGLAAPSAHAAPKSASAKPAYSPVTELRQGNVPIALRQRAAYTARMALGIMDAHAAGTDRPQFPGSGGMELFDAKVTHDGSYILGAGIKAKHSVFEHPADGSLGVERTRQAEVTFFNAADGAVKALILRRVGKGKTTESKFYRFSDGTFHEEQFFVKKNGQAGWRYFVLDAKGRREKEVTRDEMASLKLRDEMKRLGIPSAQ